MSERTTLNALHQRIVDCAARNLSQPEAAIELNLQRPSLFVYARKHGIKFRSIHNTLDGEAKVRALALLTSNAALPVTQRLSNTELAKELGIGLTQLKKLKPKNSFVLKYSNDDWQQAIAKLRFTSANLEEVKTSMSAEVTCHCGRTFETRVDSVLRANVQSCGCWVSGPQVAIFELLKDFSPQMNVTGLLPGKAEVDIYVPQKKVAIEYCGLHWHRASSLQDNNYHRAKFMTLEKQGIQLLTIFEDEWLKDRDLVSSMILNKMGVVGTKIGARKTTVTSDALSCKAHLKLHHIQGSAGSIFLGLKYQEKVVAAMSFRRNPRLTKGWELCRFAVIRNTTVQGGFTKLLARFREQHSTEEVVSLSDNRWSVGAIYSNNGFALRTESKPSHYYIDGRKRLHKSNFSLRRLRSRDLLLPGETEAKCTERLGIEKIYDCGKKTWVIGPLTSGP